MTFSRTFALMNRFVWIGILVLLALTGCISPDNDFHGTSLQTIVSPELTAIDSLMWQQPDSALMRLLPYFDTCRDVACNVYPENNDDNSKDVARYVSTNSEYNRHYAQLLLAELLYKNDYTQTNRSELLQAIDYFDSLVNMPGADTRGVSLRRHNRRDASHASATMSKSIAFLDARTHYINGVGCYENDSVVEACAEYLKALEVMESRFGEKELVGKKAKFMAYTNNRLGDIFSEQFMMNSAIERYEDALMYCKIEPTSPQCISNTLFRIGKQYDKKNEIAKARLYFEQAIEGMKNKDNFLYRDIVSSKALCDYQLGVNIEQVMDELRKTVAQAASEEERLNRFLTIAAIYKAERAYDSALYYFIPVFQNETSLIKQILAAESMRDIYDSINNREKFTECASFLAGHKKSEGENKALVSVLEGLHQTYITQKQENEAKAKQKTAIKKVFSVFVPIAVALTMTIIILMRRKRKKQVEFVRQTHKMQQSALSGRLKQSNQEVRKLKEQIKRQENLVTKVEIAESFDQEPICRLILERVNDGQFKSKVNYLNYKDSALSKQQLLALRTAANQHFDQFTIRLKNAYPQLTNSDLDYCCLYLLGLNNAELAALMQRAYSTVNERDNKLKKVFGNENPLPITMMSIASNICI